MNEEQQSKATFAQEIEAFAAQYPHIEEVDLISTDLAGNFFGKRYPMRKLQGMAEKGFAIPASMFLMGSHGEPIEMQQGWYDGDPDVQAQVIPGSLTLSTWLNKERAQMLFTTEMNGQPNYFEPRNLLKKVLEIFSARDLKPVVAFELEFSLLDPKRDEKGMAQIVHNPKTGQRDGAAILGRERISDFEDVLDDIVQTCKLQDIKTGAICAEMGSGQYEINFEHYNDALEAADKTCLFKRIVKEVAKKHGMLASFIAKPFLDEPGNGLHMHVSIVDKDGRNIFDGGDKASKELIQAIGGLMQLMPESMALYAPNVNSYRRYTAQSCATVSRTWGYENRTVAFRVPLAQDGAWRVENRVCGADANPYIAMAGTLAGLHYGMNNNVDAGEPSIKSIDKSDSDLPFDLPSALALCKDSEAFKVYFGEEFMSLYYAHRKSELKVFEAFINAREYDWYL